MDKKRYKLVNRQHGAGWICKEDNTCNEDPLIGYPDKETCESYCGSTKHFIFDILDKNQIANLLNTLKKDNKNVAFYKKILF